MKKVVHLFILLLVALITRAQQSTSSEQQAYIEKQQKNYIPFKPIEKEKLLAFHSFGITITETADYTPYTAAYEWSPAQKNSRQANGKLRITSDSGVPDFSIIKQEENEQLKAILYTNFEYDELDQAGIWIAVYYRNENTWHKYYTGVTTNTPLHFKWNSKFSLIKNDTTLQLEASIIQRLDVVSQPIMMGKFQLIKDGLVVAFDLNKMIRQ